LAQQGEGRRPAAVCAVGGDLPLAPRDQQLYRPRFLYPDPPDVLPREVGAEEIQPARLAKCRLNPLAVDPHLVVRLAATRPEDQFEQAPLPVEPPRLDGLSGGRSIL